MMCYNEKNGFVQVLEGTTPRKDERALRRANCHTCQWPHHETAFPDLQSGNDKKSDNDGIMILVLGSLPSVSIKL